ncbi:MAG: hypothetical protein VB027_03930 [Gordonibacter sp.]|nr:hypothetical protein [Gordonibacter sp.]
MKVRSDLHWRSKHARSSVNFRASSVEVLGYSFRFARFPLAVFVLVGVVVLAVTLLLVTGGLQGIWPTSLVGQESEALVASADQSGASAMVEVALDELHDASVSGDASEWRNTYNRFVGQASTGPWSTAFVVYCGDLCGFVELALMPCTAYASEFRRYFEDNPEKGTVYDNDGKYIPQPGDIVVLNETAQGALGIVEYYDESSKILKVIEGDVDGRVAEINYGQDAPVVAFIAPSYPQIAPAPLDAGETIIIPPGLGNIDSFEGWSLVTDPTSNEYQLRASAGEQYNAEGFGVINGRYVVAVRPLYGSVGDCLTFTFEDGSTLECIIGDVKGEDGLGVNEWGFLGGENILEFMVSTSDWYGGHENPGTASCHPEWGQYLVKCTNTGNYGGW